MDTKEYIKKVSDLRAELFRLAKMGKELIENVLAEKGDITEERLYDGEDENDRDWIWLDFRWDDDCCGNLCLVQIWKEGDNILVELQDNHSIERASTLLENLPPSDRVEIANQLCYIYDNL